MVIQYGILPDDTSIAVSILASADIAGFQAILTCEGLYKKTFTYKLVLE